MFRIIIATLVITALSACGGSRYASSNARSNQVAYPVTPSAAAAINPATGGVVAPEVIPLPFAKGPIFSACQADGRKAASRARCGCVQAVADRSLSGSDQRRGTKYFTDPAALQEVRQSDNAGNERFWLAWKAFGQAASATCKGS